MVTIQSFGGVDTAKAIFMHRTEQLSCKFPFHVILIHVGGQFKERAIRL